MSPDECGQGERVPWFPGARSLDGVTILEFSRHPGGSFACAIMASMGAEVILIQVENGCDMSRAACRKRDRLARCKRLLGLNLAHPEAADILHRIVRRVDVVVSDLEKVNAASLRVDYPTLAAVNRGLIYVEGDQIEQLRVVQTPAWLDPAWRN